MMALISVVSHCKETAVELETVLRDRGHAVESVVDSDLTARREGTKARETRAQQNPRTALYIVDLDCDSQDAVTAVRELAENPSTTLVPALVAASPESQKQVALACAYGATDLLRKPFSTMETVPGTERALMAASPAR